MKRNSRSWTRAKRAELATAIDEAENRTGHQILVSVGPLKHDAADKADSVAARWPQASIVVCIDPSSCRFELRWRDASFQLDASHLETFASAMRNDDLTAAIAVLAHELPIQAPTQDLPDILEN